MPITKPEEHHLHGAQEEEAPLSQAKTNDKGRVWLSSARAIHWVEDYKGKERHRGLRQEWFRSRPSVCARRAATARGEDRPGPRGPDQGLDRGSCRAKDSTQEAARTGTSLRSSIRFRTTFAFIANCALDRVPYEVCLEELEEAPLWWEEDDAIEANRVVRDSRMRLARTRSPSISPSASLNGRPKPQQ